MIVRNNNAMTLVETLFCVAFFAIISAACMNLLHIAWVAWDESTARADLSAQLRQTVSWVSNDLKQSGSGAIIDVPADDEWHQGITFMKAQDVVSDAVVWGGQVVFGLGGSTGKQVMRTAEGHAKPIAVHINSLRFRRHSTEPNLVEVEARASVPTSRAHEELTSNLNFKVYLRN